MYKKQLTLGCASLLVFFAFISGCKKSNDDQPAGNNNPGQSNNPPFVFSDASINEKAINVSVSGRITLSFSNSIDQTSVRYKSSSNNVKLYPTARPSEPESIVVSYDGTSMHIEPIREPKIDLDANTDYTLEVQTSVRDVYMQNLNAPYTLHFKTGAGSGASNLITLIKFNYAPDMVIEKFLVFFDKKSVVDPNTGYERPGLSFENSQILVTNPLPPVTASGPLLNYEAVVSHPYELNTKYYFALKVCATGNNCSRYTNEAAKNF